MSLSWPSSKALLAVPRMGHINIKSGGLQEFGVMRFVSRVDDFDEISHRGRE